MADVEDASADHVRRHCPDALGDDRLLARGHIGLAPAVRAVLGFDPAEQQVLRAAGAEDEALDARDFHGSISWLELAAVSTLRSPGESRDPPIDRAKREPWAPSFKGQRARSTEPPAQLRR